MNLPGFFMMLDRIGFGLFTGFLTVLWQSVLILAVCLEIVHSLRRHGAGIRFMILAGGLIAMPVLPVMNAIIAGIDTPLVRLAVIPDFRMPQHVPAPVTSLQIETERLASPSPELNALPLPEETSVSPRPLLTISPLRIPWAYGLLLYMGVALFLLLSLAVGTFRVRRRIRGCTAVTDHRTLRLVEDISARLGITRLVTVLESDCAAFPFVYGVRRPMLVLPRGFSDGRPDECYRGVLAHELMHIRRIDTVTLPMLAAIRTVFWFHPLVWAALRECRLLAENACDEAAVSITGTFREYAGLLTTLADTMPSRSIPRGYAAGLFTRHSFRQRVEAILAVGRHGVMPLSRWRAMLISAALAAALLTVLSMQCTGVADTDETATIEETAGRRLHITGRVVRDGAPVAGAALYAMSRDGRTAPFTHIPQSDASGRDGTFSFDVPAPETNIPNVPGAVTVIVHHPDHSIGWTTVLDAPEPEPVTIELQEPQTITGTVTDSEGAPIAHAKVVPYHIHMPSSPTSMTIETLSTGVSLLGHIDVLDAISDGNGRFNLKNMPSGGEILMTVEAEGYARRQAHRIAYGTHEFFHVTLQREGIIRGSATYAPTGEPAIGVQVFAQGIQFNPDGQGWAQGGTDNNGMYELDSLSKGLYNVWIFDYDDPDGSPVWTAVAAESVLVEAGEINDNINLELVKGGFISGRLTDRDTGEPLEGVGVGFYSSARPRSGAAMESVYTDANGEYRFRAAPGEVHVYLPGIVPPGYQRPSGLNADVHVEEGEEVTGVDFQLVQE